ncbi:MAG: hypothetical protein KDK36_18580 [Leptospiraceae bacterium]|nr:hypothetical protein [Leptospiraceae bacterium]
MSNEISEIENAIITLFFRSKLNKNELSKKLILDKLKNYSIDDIDKALQSLVNKEELISLEEGKLYQLVDK